MLTKYTILVTGIHHEFREPYTCGIFETIKDAKDWIAKDDYFGNYQ